MRSQKQQIFSLFWCVLCLALLLFGCADSNKAVDPSDADPVQGFTSDRGSYGEGIISVPGAIWLEVDSTSEVDYNFSLFMFGEDSSFRQYNYQSPTETSSVRSGEWSVDEARNLILNFPGQETVTVQLFGDNIDTGDLDVLIDDGTDEPYGAQWWWSGGRFDLFDDSLIPGTYTDQYGDRWVLESNGVGSSSGMEETFTWEVNDGILKVTFEDGRTGLMYGNSCSQSTEDYYSRMDFAFVEYAVNGGFDSYHGRMRLVRQVFVGNISTVIPDSDPTGVITGVDPCGIAVDSMGSLYIADGNGNRVLKVSAEGVITTVAGTGEAGFSGDGGPATSAQLGSPMDVAVDSSGNLYIADELNQRIRKVTPQGIISTIAGGGDITQRYAYLGGDDIRQDIRNGEPATSVGLLWTCDVAVDRDGNVYFFESGIFGPPAIILKVSPDGLINTFAGGGSEGIGDDVPAASIGLSSPGLAIDSAGYLYIANGGYNCVLEATPDGMIYTVAGTGAEGYSGDGGPAIEAELALPDGIAIAEDGTLYIADFNNYCIRMVTPEGVISTLIYLLDRPEGIAVAPNGDLFVVEGNGYTGRRRVLKLESKTIN